MRKRVVLLAVLVGIFILISVLLSRAMTCWSRCISASRPSAACSSGLAQISGGHHAGDAADAHRCPAGIAVFTVAMPGIANPGVLDAAVLLTDNTPLSLVEETGLTVGTIPIVLVALLTTHRSQRLLGNAVIRRRPAPRSWG